MRKRDGADAEFDYIAYAIDNAAERVKSAEFLQDSSQAPEVRLADLRYHYERLCSIYKKIIEKETQAKCVSINERMAEIDEKYLFALGKMTEKVQQTQKVSSQAQPIVQMNIPFRESEVRSIWGEFDGTIKKWPGFRDRFVAAVHNNADISPADKFQHLRHSLIGKAAIMLGERQLTAENFQLAWERLLQLYDDKDVINRELLRTLFKLPVLTASRRANDLQKMSDVTHETLRQLKAQGVPVEHWDLIVVFILQERLNAETAKQWQLQRPSGSATVKELQLQALEEKDMNEGRGILALQ